MPAGRAALSFCWRSLVRTRSAALDLKKPVACVNMSGCGLWNEAAWKIALSIVLSTGMSWRSNWSAHLRDRPLLLDNQDVFGMVMGCAIHICVFLATRPAERVGTERRFPYSTRPRIAGSRKHWWAILDSN